MSQLSLLEKFSFQLRHFALAENQLLARIAEETLTPTINFWTLRMSGTDLQYQPAPVSRSKISPHQYDLRCTLKHSFPTGSHLQSLILHTWTGDQAFTGPHSQAILMLGKEVQGRSGQSVKRHHMHEAGKGSLYVSLDISLAKSISAYYLSFPVLRINTGSCTC